MGGPIPADYRVEDIARAYISDMQRVRPSGPYFLGGMCMGGILALEMAQQLVAKGERVELLVIVDTWLTDPRRYEPGFLSFATSVAKNRVGVVLALASGTRAAQLASTTGTEGGVRRVLALAGEARQHEPI